MGKKWIVTIMLGIFLFLLSPLFSEAVPGELPLYFTRLSIQELLEGISEKYPEIKELLEIHKEKTADGKWKEVQKWLVKQIEENPHKRAFYFSRRARWLVNLGEFETAYQDIQKACLTYQSNDPEDWEVLSELTYHVGRDPVLAITYIDILLEMEPKNNSGYLLRGIMHYNLDNYVAATEDFFEGYCLTGDSEVFYLMLSCMYQAKAFRKLTEFLQEYFDSLSQREEFRKNFLRYEALFINVLGECFHRDPRSQDILYLEKLLAVRFNNDVCHAWLAVLKAQMGDKSGSRKELEKVLELSPEKIELKYLCALAYYLLEDYEKARSLCVEMEKNPGEECRQIFLLGHLALQEKNLEEAKSYFLRYLERIDQKEDKFFENKEILRREGLLSLIKILVLEKKYQDASQLLEELEWAPPANLVFRFLFYRELDERELEKVTLQQAIEQEKQLSQNVEGEQDSRSGPVVLLEILYYTENQQTEKILDYALGMLAAQEKKAKLLEDICHQAISYHYRAEELACQQILFSSEKTPEEKSQAEEKLKTLQARRQQKHFRLDIPNLTVRMINHQLFRNFE